MTRTPHGISSRRVPAFGVALMTVAMLGSPFIAPQELTVVRHSTSECAGQGVPGAWMMRLGFVAYGLAVLIAALRDWKRQPLVRAALIIFGAGLVATATWSNASVLPHGVSESHEDFVHSLASSVVGLGFAAACSLRLAALRGWRRDRISWIGLAASVIIPLTMMALPELRGLLQRSMFAISFIFVMREFWPAHGSGT